MTGRPTVDSSFSSTSFDLKENVSHTQDASPSDNRSSKQELKQKSPAKKMKAEELTMESEADRLQQPSTGPSARKRTARACDKCSVARTKCDGKNPCYRCLNLGIVCQYNRTIKKRGKGSDSYPQHPRKQPKTQHASQASDSTETKPQRKNSIPPLQEKREGRQILDAKAINEDDSFWNQASPPQSKPPSPQMATTEVTSNTPVPPAIKSIPTISVAAAGPPTNYQHLTQTTSILPQLQSFLKLTTNSASNLKSSVSSPTIQNGLTPTQSTSNLNLLDSHRYQQQTDILQASSTLTSFNQSRTNSTNNLLKILNQPSKTAPSTNVSGPALSTNVIPSETKINNLNFGNSSIHNPLSFNVQLLSHLATSTNHKPQSTAASSVSTPAPAPGHIPAPATVTENDAVNPTAAASTSSSNAISTLKTEISRILPSVDTSIGKTSDSLKSASTLDLEDPPTSAGTNSQPEVLVPASLQHISISSNQSSSVNSPQWLGSVKSPFPSELISIFDRSTPTLSQQQQQPQPLAAPTEQTQSEKPSSQSISLPPNTPQAHSQTVLENEEENDISHETVNDSKEDSRETDDSASQTATQNRLDTSSGSQYTPVPPPVQAHIYPVLEPIIRDIDYMPLVLTSEFLEIYFTNTVYSVAPILRKSSILCEKNPRKCSPALLYSILYLSAHASNHPIMTSGSEYKNMLISKLLDSVMVYLQPMREENSREYDLDDVLAVINIGVVESASDFKPSTMKWWNMAVTLARQLKLNKEIPTIPEEAREERRRTWWSLFMIDRHLALCFNRPCMILDSESLELFFPISQDIWDYEVDDPSLESQGCADNGENVTEARRSSTGKISGTAPSVISSTEEKSDRGGPPELFPPEEDRNRRRGLQCTVIESGIFGMYLPLMTLLGGIIEIHFFELSPLFSHRESVLKSLRENYRHRLKAFQYSLEEFFAMTVTQDTYLLAWKEYCQCVLQVLYILLEGYWDPTDTLDDIDVLLNDTRFTGCLQNSIEASKHVEKILRLDPTLQLIPFFFGIQLLHAGFIPYCMSERYGTHTSTDVAEACELFVRAHEVSIATLSTQYQVNYRSLLHGVIRDMKYTTVSVNDRIVSTNRRRILMSMYRWNAGGTGLAV